MSVNSRIKRINRKKGFTSYQMLIIHNFRNERKNNRPDHTTLAYLGTVRSTFVNNPLYRQRFEQKLQRATNKLILQKKITRTQAEKVKAELLSVFPAPNTLPKPAHAASTISEEKRREIIERRLKPFN